MRVNFIVLTSVDLAIKNCNITSFTELVQQVRRYKSSIKRVIDDNMFQALFQKLIIKIL